MVVLSLRRAGVTGLSFEGRGERIAKGFYIPVLKESVGYDRATGYFSVDLNYQSRKSGDCAGDIFTQCGEIPIC